MNAYHRGIEALEALNDPELSQAYGAYVARLEQQLTPDEVELYRSYQQRVQSSTGPRPEEEAVAAKVDADSELQPLFDEYLARLGDRQSHPSLQDVPTHTGRARVY